MKFVRIAKVGGESESLATFRQMEKSAIDYIGKLAFRSANADVSLAAIHFLNSHFTQSDTISSVEQENQFIDSCMSYLNEARSSLDLGDCSEQTFELVQRGLLLLKTHLDTFQRRHSFQLRLMQLRASTSSSSYLDTAEKSGNDNLFFVSHLKLLQQMNSDTLSRMYKLNTFNLSPSTSSTYSHELHAAFSPFVNETGMMRVLNSIKESAAASTAGASSVSAVATSATLLQSAQAQNVFVTLACHINPTQFKFNLTLSLNDCVGDLKAIIREIILKTIKSSQVAGEIVVDELCGDTRMSKWTYSIFNSFFLIN